MMIAGTERRRQGCSLQDGKQWGFTVFDPVYYKNVNFTLPLSVNGTFCAFSTGYDAKVSTFLWHSMSHFNNVNVGVTGFVFDSRYTFTGLGYLAICWQKQWGFKEHNNTHQSTVKLPIAFKKGGYVGAANDSGTVTIGIKPTDKQTIELRDNNGGGKTGIYWFVVGQ